MADEVILSLNWIEIAGIAGGAFAFGVAAIGGVYKVLSDQVTHWKDRYTDRTTEWESSKAELVHAKENPEEFARAYVDVARKTWTEQAADVELRLRQMRDQLASRDETIRSMAEQTKEDQERLVFEVEKREKLEREIAVYEKYLAVAFDLRSLAEKVMSALETNKFSQTKVRELRNQLEGELKEIDRTSFPGSWKRLTEKSQKDAVAKAASVKRQIAAKATARAAAQNVMRARLPEPGPNS